LASLISHAVAALGIGTVFPRPQDRNRAWIIAAVCSMIPDIDVIGFRFGIRYGDFCGHRGFTHSLVFAAIDGCTGLGILSSGIRRQSHSAAGVLLLATASHGLLDAMTNGGLGAAFFSPFDNTRYCPSLADNGSFANLGDALLQ
jgi:inner membrane protein